MSVGEYNARRISASMVVSAIVFVVEDQDFVRSFVDGSKSGVDASCETTVLIQADDSNPRIELV